MRKEQIAARLARRTRLSRAEAADEVDRVVHAIIRRLRAGKPVALPGLGRLSLDEGVAKLERMNRRKLGKS